jgi:hypothetical protein
MDDVYALFWQSKLILGGILWHRDVTWHHIGALNARCDWIAETLQVAFVDPNSWIENWDFSKGELHLNQSGGRRLSHLYSIVCGCVLSL